MEQQVYYYVDARRVQAPEFFLQGFDQFSQCELAEWDVVAPVYGSLDRWLVGVPFSVRREFVQHAQHAEHVVRVQERDFAVELASL